MLVLDRIQAVLKIARWRLAEAQPEAPFVAFNGEAEGGWSFLVVGDGKCVDGTAILKMLVVHLTPELAAEAWTSAKEATK